jgi:hypothetical protein
MYLEKLWQAFFSFFWGFFNLRKTRLPGFEVGNCLRDSFSIIKKYCFLPYIHCFDFAFYALILWLSIAETGLD